MVSKLTIVIAKPAPLCSSSLSPGANEEEKQLSEGYPKSQLQNSLQEKN